MIGINNVQIADKKGNVCEFCQKEFSRPWTLNQHKRIHLGDKRFNCPLCDYQATQKISLVSHMRTHTHERPYKCPEPD